MGGAFGAAAELKIGNSFESQRALEYDTLHSACREHMAPLLDELAEVLALAVPSEDERAEARVASVCAPLCKPETAEERRKRAKRSHAKGKAKAKTKLKKKKPAHDEV
eukprot:SAG11_NODE_4277_length_1971_cov_1.058226_2_plen_108_part_00